MSKTIGVIGGLGPAATLDFFAKTLAATPAARDQDHIRLIIDCNPHVPDRNRALRGEGPSPAPVLAAMAAGLENAGADALVIACNTAHAWADEIKAAVNIPLLSMIEASVAETLVLKPRAAGLIMGDGCRLAGLYQRAFAAAGVRAVLPSDLEQERLMQAIYAIKAGDMSASMRQTMRGFAETLIAAGADVIVAACTEAPLVLSADDLSVPFVSSTDVLVARALAFARSE